MTAVAFDTLKLAVALRDKARLTQEQAEGFASAMADAMQDDLATKTDLASGLAATEARLMREIESSKAELLKWMFGAIGFQTVIVLGAVVALARAGHVG